MKTQSRLLSTLLFLLLPALLAAQPRIEVPVDTDWKFARENAPGAQAVDFRDKTWETVSLPHTWNARDGQDGGSDYYRGVGWYRKRLRVPAEYRGRSVFLRFGAAGSKAEVFVNGTSVGTHKGAFSAFCFDITPHVSFGKENLVAVRVSNAYDTTIAPLRGDFTQFGGLYRGVRMLVLDEFSVSPLDHASPGVYLTQRSVTAERAEVDVRVVLRNASARERGAVVRAVVTDRDGKSVARAEVPAGVPARDQREVTVAVAVDAPHLWNGRQDPYLYRVTVELAEGGTVRDRVTQNLGLRFFAVDPERGFFLNGKPYRLFGVNRHQDREDMGWAITMKEHDEDYRLIEEMGCTAVRLAHYQQAPEFYELCDRGGMAVWAELGMVDSVHRSAGFLTVSAAQLTDLVKQAYNHPSVFCWSIFNELMPEADRPLYARVVDTLAAVARRLDPTRFTAMATRSRYAPDEYMNTVTDLVGYNVYRGWYEGRPEGFGPFADTLHARRPGMRLSISEYGAGASIRQHEVPPSRPSTRGPWHPEEWQTHLHDVTWNQMAERSYLWGTFVWNMFDFASDTRSEGDHMGRNDKGLVTFDRKTRKDAFFVYKANWTTEPMVHIASSRFTPRPPGKTEITVYSNCDSVTLSVGGARLGTRAVHSRKVVWPAVDLLEGRVAVEATGWGGGGTVKDECMWVVSAQEAKK